MPAILKVRQAEAQRRGEAELAERIAADLVRLGAATPSGTPVARESVKPQTRGEATA